MQSVHGTTAVGYFPAIQTLSSKLDGFWTSTRAFGKENRLDLDAIWGQTRNLSARVFDWPDLAKRRSGGRRWLWRPDMGTDTMSGMPIRNVERPTLNSQLSTG